MKTDHVERLAHDKGNSQTLPPRDVQQILDEIVVQPQVRPPKSVKDYIAQEPEDLIPPGESAFFEGILTGLAWIMFALTLSAIVWLTLSAGGQYLAR